MTFNEYHSLLMLLLDNPFECVHLSFRPGTHERHQCRLKTASSVQWYCYVDFSFHNLFWRDAL